MRCKPAHLLFPCRLLGSHTVVARVRRFLALLLVSKRSAAAVVGFICVGHPLTQSVPPLTRPSSSTRLPQPGACK